MGFSKVWGSVLLCHCAIVLFLFFTQSIPVKKMTKQKTTVRTIALAQSTKAMRSSLAFLDESIARPMLQPSEEPISPSVSPPISQEKNAPEETPASSPSPKPTSSKKTVSPVSKKSSTSKKTVEIKKAKPNPITQKSKENPERPNKNIVKPDKKSSPPTRDPQKEKMLALVKDSLSQLDKSNAGSSGKKTGSKNRSDSSYGKIDALNSENLSIGEMLAATYQEELSAYLRHLLQLPEIGEVKLRLTLTKEGKVAQVAVVSSSSDKNRQYAEKKIPTLSFPPFGERLKGEQEHTFPVTLTSTVTN